MVTSWSIEYATPHTDWLWPPPYNHHQQTWTDDDDDNESTRPWLVCQCLPQNCHLLMTLMSVLFFWDCLSKVRHHLTMTKTRYHSQSTHKDTSTVSHLSSVSAAWYRFHQRCNESSRRKGYSTEVIHGTVRCGTVLPTSYAIVDNPLKLCDLVRHKQYDFYLSLVLP